MLLVQFQSLFFPLEQKKKKKKEEVSIAYLDLYIEPTWKNEKI